MPKNLLLTKMKTEQVENKNFKIILFRTHKVKSREYIQKGTENYETEIGKSKTRNRLT